MTLAEFEILWLIDHWGPLTATELHMSGQFPHVRHWQGYAAKLVSLERRGLVYRKDPKLRIWDLTEDALDILAR